MPNKPKATRTRKTMKRRPYKTARKGVLNQRKKDNYATIEETYSVAVTAGVTYNQYHRLVDLIRAQTLAQAYQYYRITSIVYRFKPQYDTFSTMAPSTIPQLYFQYDRSNSLPALSIPEFERLGNRPIRFDDKILTKYLKPAVIGESSGNLPASYRITPWLPTNTDGTGGFVASVVEHYGAVFNITKMYPTDATVYDLDISMTVQFKAPLVVHTNNAPKQKAPINAQAEVINMNNQPAV